MSAGEVGLRALPSVDQVLRAVPGFDEVGPQVARWIARREIAAARARVVGGGDAGDVIDACARAVSVLQARGLARVINATGVVLHTNLGRAPLSRDAVAAVVAASGPTAVEYDVATGARAGRAPVAAMLAAALCDAEDALIVNNNAASLLLLLGALAAGRDVLVGRGELIEIGGGFRLPEIMAASGARLREVGTTNKTRAADYRTDEHTALILKVHPSNYEVVGFTTVPTVAELAEVARAAGVPLVYDTGSGLLAPSALAPDEPSASAALAEGADLVCFSGDKLLGGPQAGVIAGRADLVAACRAHPVARAVRADKLTLAALEATLWAHARGTAVPVTAMLGADLATLRARAAALAAGVPGARVEDGTSVPGGGSLPGVTLPACIVAVPDAEPDARAVRLRAHDPPVITRVGGGCVLVDLRTVDPSDDDLVRAALADA